MRRSWTCGLVVFCAGWGCARSPLPPPLPRPEAPAAAPGPAAPARPINDEVAVLVAGGDVTLGYHYEEYVDELISKGTSRDEALAHGFRRLAPLVDPKALFVVNLECPFTESGEKIPKNFNFRARRELIGSLLSGGVDAVSLANNHLMDYGASGLYDTLATLDGAKVAHFGAGRSLAEARRFTVVERSGVRFAFLGYFFLGDRNIEPKEVIADASAPGVAGHFTDVAVLEKWVREDVALAKTQADVVIPFFHWGIEGTTQALPYQIQLGHAAVEAGAALVLGSHPHVLQGIELYRGAPIVYSLGNLVFGGNWNPRNKESALVKARFSRSGLLGVELIPLQTDRHPEVLIQPFPLEGEAARAVLAHLADYSKEFAATLPVLQLARD